MKQIASNLWPGKDHLVTGDMGGKEWDDGDWHKAWWWVAYYTEVIGRYETDEKFDKRVEQYLDFFDACYDSRHWQWFMFGLSKLLAGVNFLRKKNGHRILEDTTRGGM